MKNIFALRKRKSALCVSIDAAQFDSAVINLIAEDLRVSGFFEKLSVAGLEGKCLQWRPDKSILMLLGFRSECDNLDVRDWYNIQVQGAVHSGSKNEYELAEEAKKIYAQLKKKAVRSRRLSMFKVGS